MQYLYSVDPPAPPSQPHHAARGCVRRSCQLKELLWMLFSHPVIDNSSSSSSRHSEGVLLAGADAAEAVEATPSTDTGAHCLFDSRAALLHLCGDSDLYNGIAKAAAAVTRTADPSVALTAADVSVISYPLLQPEALAAAARAPVGRTEIAAAVSSAAAAGLQLRASSSPLSAVPTTASRSSGTEGSGGGSSVAAGPQDDGDASTPPPPSIQLAQLFHSPSCERIMTMLLHRYRWHDVFLAACLGLYHC